MSDLEARRVLIIDDSSTDAEALQRILVAQSERHRTVKRAETAEEGLQELRSDRWDCVLLDYALADACGLDVIQKIRSEGNDVPIVFVTGQGDEDIVVKSFRFGAQEYISKSKLSPNAIETTMKEAITKVARVRQDREHRQGLKSFAEKAAHDLLAPSRRMAIMAEELRSDLQNERMPDEEYVRYLEVNSKRMHALVEKLLQHARMGRLTLERQNLDLNAIVANALDNVKLDIEESHAEVHVGPLPKVMGDEIALTQTFQNLIANSLKFCHRTPRISVTAEKGICQWIISIEDNGIGIPEDRREEIFTPFIRCNSQSEFEGSGIGLATCAEVIDQHGGKIWVASSSDQGTTIRLTIEAEE